MSNLQSNQENEQEALLEQKIASYLPTLYKIAFLQLKSEADAEDIVQEVFCQFIKTSKVFESEEHERAWLIKVTLNACKKIWRSAWYRYKAPLPEGDYGVTDPALQPEDECIYMEDKAQLMKAIWALPDKYRDVIHLFYYEELSIKEIAVIVERQESTITSQLTRGRNILKKRLKEEYRFEEF